MDYSKLDSEVKQVIYEMACDFRHKEYSTPDEIDYKFWENIPSQDIAAVLAIRLVDAQKIIESKNKLLAKIEIEVAAIKEKLDKLGL